MHIGKVTPDRKHLKAYYNKIAGAAKRFDAPGPEMEQMLDFHVDRTNFRIPVRLYSPFELPEDHGPIIIFFHGGGFVTGGIHSHTGICQRLAHRAGIRVLSVDYRLAPKFPYPIGLNDCEFVLEWVLSGLGEIYGIDPTAVALAGDSAGGNIAAYLAQKYRRDLRAQVLMYPLMQLAEIKPHKPGPQDVLQIGTVALGFIRKYYVVGANVNHPSISPLFESDLSGVPPALVLTCGLDPLRFEGKLYAEKLQAHGIKVRSLHVKKMPHGYLNYAKAFPGGDKIALEAGAFLRETLND